MKLILAVLVVVGMFTSSLLVSFSPSQKGKQPEKNEQPVIQPVEIVIPANPINPTNPVTPIKLQVRYSERELVLNDRTVYIYGAISNNFYAISRAILSLGQDPEPITILINSPGGSVIAGAQIIAAMQAVKSPVRTVCVELCASMAAIIHSYGTSRLMIDHSILMFHPASGGVEGEVNKMNSKIAFFKKYVDGLNENVAKRAGLTTEQFKAMWEVEHWVDAQDAVSERLSDGIVYVRGSSALKLYPDSEIRMASEIVNDFNWE
jgi:ATP-dependent Clp protease, protease subunit